jgi:hypothetical protein
VRFVLFFCDDESARLSPQRIAEHPGHQAWLADMTRRRVYRSGGRLRPVADSSTVRVREGSMLVSDGPFAETKDLVGGYALVECADLDEAIDVAARHPVAEYGAVEVRPLRQI